MLQFEPTIYQGDCMSVLPTLARGNDGRFLPGGRYNQATEFKPGQHWRPKKPHWGPRWLFWQYRILGRSSGDIAAVMGCTSAAIQFMLRKFGIKRRTTAEARKLKHWGAAGEKNPMFNRRGPLNHNWKGGLTPWRQKMYSKWEWRDFARRMFARDRCCRLCGAKKGAKLVLHHIHKVCDAPLLLMDEENVIVLCEACHHRIQGREKWWRKRLLAIRAKDAAVTCN